MPLTDPRAALDDQTVVRGDQLTWTITITRKNSDGTSSPVNLTSYGTAWTGLLRGTPDSTLSVAWSIDSSNAATGVLVLSLAASQTAAMLLPVYGYDLQVTGGAVSPQTPFRGTLYVVKDYTHA